MTSASPCTSIETSVPALRLSRSRTAFGMAICPFEETVVLVISTYYGKTDSLTMQMGKFRGGKIAAVSNWTESSSGKGCSCLRHAGRLLLRVDVDHFRTVGSGQHDAEA